MEEPPGVGKDYVAVKNYNCFSKIIWSINRHLDRCRLLADCKHTVEMLQWCDWFLSGSAPKGMSLLGQPKFLNMTFSLLSDVLEYWCRHYLVSFIVGTFSSMVAFVYMYMSCRIDHTSNMNFPTPKRWTFVGSNCVSHSNAHGYLPLWSLDPLSTLLWGSHKLD